MLTCLFWSAYQSKNLILDPILPMHRNKNATEFLMKTESGNKEEIVEIGEENF